MGSGSAHVGMLIDDSGLRVVAVIASITASTARERHPGVRDAVIKAASRIVPAFGEVARFALVEPGSRGHILIPCHVDGHEGAPVKSRGLAR